MITLTMFSLTDFIGEIGRTFAESPEVRCQPMRETRGGGQMGPKAVFKIVLTHCDCGNEVVVACTLVVGETRAVFLDHEPWHGRNLDVALKMVIGYLEQHRFLVLPGAYAYEDNGRASCHLWRIDRETHELMAIEEGDDDDQNR